VAHEHGLRGQQAQHLVAFEALRRERQEHLRPDAHLRVVLHHMQPAQQAAGARERQCCGERLGVFCAQAELQRHGGHEVVPGALVHRVRRRVNGSRRGCNHVGSQGVGWIGAPECGE
jgi:hypothetical protein